jgi:hypothetical protein
MRTYFEDIQDVVQGVSKIELSDLGLEECPFCSRGFGHDKTCIVALAKELVDNNVL